MQTTHAQVRPEQQEIREIADADERFDERSSEGGMATAELLGNAALGIAALVAIWAVLQTLGLDIVDWIRGQLKM